MGGGRSGGGWVGGGVGLWGGGQGGCERRIEVFVKIQKKKNFEGGGSGRVRWGGRVGGMGGLVWVRADVNAILGVGGDVSLNIFYSRNLTK